MPLNAFIIRPFGKKTIDKIKEVEKDGKKSKEVETIEIDFDRVQRELIQPALDALRLQGNTTEAVLSGGNIREDMFHLLVTADLVIADVTLHNANVFYELGIRHAFHDKYTFLIRSDVSTYPFDLQTDRYLQYKHERPREGVEKLCEALRATLASERADSPVFRLLPLLRAEDRSRFISVPRDFIEEVERARKHKLGGDLRLLAVECEGFLWEIEGLRIIGRAQFELNYIGGATATWEAITARYPNDVEANTILSTLYQLLGQPVRSEQSLTRVSRLNSLDINTVSEIRALNGRNYKARWIGDWMKIKGDLAKRQQRALQSPLLRKAYEDYEAAFRANLNNSYAGLNALSLLIAEVVLAQLHPETWEIRQERLWEGQRELWLREERIKKLISALDFTMDSERSRLQQQGRVDFWFEMLEAAFLCLTEEKPERVRQAYLEAVIWAPAYAEEAMKRGLELFGDLGIEQYGKVSIRKNREIAMEAIRSERHDNNKAGRILLFAGMRMEAEKWEPQHAAETVLEEISKHRNGAGDAEQKGASWRKRAQISYLRDDMEAIAKEKIKEKITSEKARGEILFGMAGGACGSDLLFHEICNEMAINTKLYLALPKDQYVGEYVAPAGADWVERFHHIYRHLEVLDKTGRSLLNSSAPATAPTEPREPDSDVDKYINLLASTKELPRWLQGKANYNLERRCHVWMLQHALMLRHVYGRAGHDVEITLIVLWDGGVKVGLGGIGHLVELAERHGIKVVKIDCRDWLDLEPAVVPLPELPKNKKEKAPAAEASAS
ncbi:MAG TPA: tetratricopeptide repeat-containing protein [Blastocatellia bacterium]|nr:tetratricopeptide repeat-containing protein [Blastocatellia bacterium]